MGNIKKGSKLEHSKAGSITSKQEVIGGIILFLIIILALAIFLFKDFNVVEEPALLVVLVEDKNLVEDRYNSLHDAIASGDVTACDSLGPAERIVCLQSISGVVGEDELSSQEVIDAAVESEDSSVCESISDPVEKVYCQAMSGQAPDTSSSLENNPAVANIIQQAFDTGDASLCNQIENPAQKQLCLNQVG